MERFGFSANRLANTHPAAPPPTINTSYFMGFPSPMLRGFSGPRWLSCRPIGHRNKRRPCNTVARESWELPALRSDAGCASETADFGGNFASILRLITAKKGDVPVFPFRRI